MGNRLTKIYTRTGDDGTTGLADGTRLPKDDLRFMAMGSVDLLNSHIGLLRALLSNITLEPKAASEHGFSDIQQLDYSLSRIQHWLFNVGGELAMPEFTAISLTAISELEKQMDEWHTHLPVLKEFILPAGSQATCQAHIARCTCREAERLLVALNRHCTQTKQLPIASNTLTFINRLSDWLFVLARVVARLTPIQLPSQPSDLLSPSSPEVYWQKEMISS